MNWGVIAVYSCVNSCAEQSKEYVVIQDAADFDNGGLGGGSLSRRKKEESYN